MRSYKAARGLFSFLSVLAWIVIVGGVLIALLGFSQGGRMGMRGPNLGPFIAALPGVGTAIIGFFMLAMSQLGRATVDTAEYSQQMLQVSREQVEVSKQVLRQGAQFEKGYTALAARLEAVSTSTYAGRSEQETPPPDTTPALASPETTPKKAGYAAKVKLEQATAGVESMPKTRQSKIKT